jgi:hypothetical protein
LRPVCRRPEMHIRWVRGSKVQEMGIKHDCTRSNEELSPCDLLDVRKKVSAQMYEMSSVSILLSLARFAEPH